MRILRPGFNSQQVSHYYMMSTFGKSTYNHSIVGLFCKKNIKQLLRVNEYKQSNKIAYIYIQYYCNNIFSFLNLNIFSFFFVVYTQYSFLLIAVLVINSMAFPYLLIGIVPLFVLFIWFREYYMRAAREIRRLEASCKFHRVSFFVHLFDEIFQL